MKLSIGNKNDESQKAVLAVSDSILKIDYNNLKIDQIGEILNFGKLFCGQTDSASQQIILEIFDILLNITHIEDVNDIQAFKLKIIPAFGKAWLDVNDPITDRKSKEIGISEKVRIKTFEFLLKNDLHVSERASFRK